MSENEPTVEDLLKENDRLRNLVKDQEIKIISLEKSNGEKEEFIEKLMNENGDGIERAKSPVIPNWYKSSPTKEKKEPNLMPTTNIINRSKSPLIPVWYSTDPSTPSNEEDVSSPHVQRNVSPSPMKWFHGKEYIDGREGMFFFVGGRVIDPSWDFSTMPCRNWDFVEEKSNGKMMYRCLGHY